ncbi:unnamed protein product, partial [Urochloa humidicola]
MEATSPADVGDLQGNGWRGETPSGRHAEAEPATGLDSNAIRPRRAAYGGSRGSEDGHGRVGSRDL